MVVICFILLNLEIVGCDLYTEAKYSEIIQERPETGPAIVTFVSGCQKLGSLASYGLVGYLADHEMFQLYSLIALFLSGIPLIPALLGWLPEKRMFSSPPETIGNQYVLFCQDLYQRNRKIILLSIMAGCCGVGITFLSLFTRVWISVIWALGSMALVIFGSYYVFPRSVANATAYIALMYITRPSLDSAIDYYYTANPDCAPNGPHFSFEFYVTYVGLASVAVSFIALVFYQRIFSVLTFRWVCLLTSTLYSISFGVDVAMLLGVYSWLGLRSSWFYLIGSMLKNFCQIVQVVPVLILISKLCVKGVESTTYAFLIGIYNLSIMISNLLGSLLFEIYGVKTSSSHCSFETLYVLILVFNIALPMIYACPAACYLLPNKFQSETVIVPVQNDVEMDQVSGN